MKACPYIMILFLLYGCLSITPSLVGQGQLTPKFGYERILSSPTIQQHIWVHGKSGFITGIEYRMGQDKVYFVPSLMYSNNRADIFQIDTLNLEAEPALIESINLAYINLNVLMGVELIRFNSQSRMSLRTGLTMAYNVSMEEWGSYGVRQDAHRKYNWKYVTGLDFEIGRVVLCIDYNLSYLREFRSSNLVRNSVGLTLGYTL